MEGVNIYLMQNMKNKHGGNFYNVYLSKKRDLKIEECESIEEFEDNLKLQDEDVKKSGGIIVGKDEYINSAIIYSNTEEEERTLALNDIDAEILRLYYEKDRLFKKYLKKVVELDARIREAYEEKAEIEENFQKKLGM